MNRYKHIVFNPQIETIDLVIDRLGANPIWCLSHIVSFNEWKSVAVFESWDSTADEEKEYNRNLGIVGENSAIFTPPNHY